MTKQATIRVGVVGAGGIAQVAHIPNLKAITDVDLSALCDPDLGRAAAVAGRYRIPAWYDDPAEMLQEERLDALVIVTPTITHLPICQVAFENDTDVMVEKPFARNSDEARRIVELAEKHDRVVMVGMNHRFREDTRLLKGVLQEGSLGDIISIRAGWLKRLGVWGRPYWFMDPNLSGGGVLIDLGLQMIDLVLYLLDYPIVVEAYCGISEEVLGLDVEDNAAGFVRFENGTIFQFEVSWAHCYDKDVAFTYISGSHGGAALNPLRLLHRRGDQVTREQTPTLEDEVELYRRSFKAEIAHFITCIRDRMQPISSGEDAVKAMDVIRMLYRSAD